MKDPKAARRYCLFAVVALALIFAACRGSISQFLLVLALTAVVVGVSVVRALLDVSVIAVLIVAPVWLLSRLFGRARNQGQLEKNRSEEDEAS